MRHLIIDITELTTWQGKLTGVPRVMNELASRFASSQDTVFVSWDSMARDYKMHDITGIAQGYQAAVSSSGKPTTKLSGTVKAAKKLKAKSPIAGKMLGWPERAAKKILLPKVFQPSNQRISPSGGDVLFILADWHGSDESFVSQVEQWHKKGVKLVQISYDLLPIVTPQFSGHATDSLTRYTKRIYPLCEVIIAISKNTKKDVTNWLKSCKLPVPPIEVIRLGEDFVKAEPRKPMDRNFEEAIKGADDFLLCVGTIEARKNHALLYNTYKLADQQAIKLPPIVIAGRRGWKSENIFELMTSDSQVKNSLVILQNASDEELSWLYDNCLFSIYPSFYEGWGLPIAESIAHQKPCIASNTSSMPEIAGDLIDYFNPDSPDECLAAITKLLDPKKLKVAKERIKAYKPTSWDDSFWQVEKIVKGADG
jgi:glycosyltransferase involved in cell wall biosynthesis